MLLKERETKLVIPTGMPMVLSKWINYNPYKGRL